MHDYHLSTLSPVSPVSRRIRQVFGIFLMASMLCAPTVLRAQDPEQITQLSQLNRAGMPAEAFALANQLLPVWEGEPAFDLEYGIASVDSGFFSEGIFALERVMMDQPENNYGRLELARAYFAAQEDDRARVEFERVLASNPPDEVRENVRPYLDTISAREGRRRAVWRGNLELMTGYDSNINASTDDDLSALIGLPPGTLETATPQEDIFESLVGSLTWSKPLTAVSDISVATNLNYRQNASGDLPQSTAGLSVAYSLRRDANSYRVALQGNHFRLEKTAYRDMTGLSASWTHTMSPQTSYTLFGQASDLSYDSTPGKDSLLVVGGLSVQHQFAATYRPSLTFGVTAGYEDANDDTAPGALQNTEKDTYGANIGLGLSFTPNLQLSTSLRAQKSEYAEELVLPPVLRKDLNISANVALNWRAADNWIIAVAATTTDNDSTAGFTDYQRQQISLSARYLFR